ncbi:MAG TPA: DUF433 domain-containing protein [Thermoanaerobaculia bacterium]|nr:DUF433 domain-containing protein [Thermoanaerobaculia bacterium]
MVTRNQIVYTDPEILAGEPVFVGTRVPLHNLFDYLEAGDSLEVFLDSFPDVSREQAVAALELAKESMSAGASSR